MSNKLTVSQLDRIEDGVRARPYDVDVLSDALRDLLDIVRDHLDDHDAEDMGAKEAQER